MSFEHYLLKGCFLDDLLELLSGAMAFKDVLIDHNLTDTRLTTNNIYLNMLDTDTIFVYVKILYNC